MVGPIRDEFDDDSPGVKRLDDGSVEMPGSLALSEAADELELHDLAEEAEDTIGGHVVAVLGRLPRKGDRLQIGPYRATVVDVFRRRISVLRFTPSVAEPNESDLTAA